MFLLPKLILTLPLIPDNFPFFITTLMIPAFPSASYFAEGLVITSICFTDDAGICFKTSLPFNVVGLPSIRTTKSELPRKVTLPCGSTCTEGVFSRAVAALPPALFKSFSTFTTLRSILYSTFVF